MLRALGSSRLLVRASPLDASLPITLSGAVLGVLTRVLIGLTWVSGLGDLMPRITSRFPIVPP